MSASCAREISHIRRRAVQSKFQASSLLTHFLKRADYEGISTSLWPSHGQELDSVEALTMWRFRTPLRASADRSLSSMDFQDRLAKAHCDVSKASREQANLADTGTR